MTTLDTAVEGLDANVLLGPVVRPGDGTYDEVRQVWNGHVQRRPAVIVRCCGVSDVVA